MGSGRNGRISNMAVNKVFLTGNLTRDPELRSTASGTSVLSFGIAVNERVKNNQTGEWEDRPNYIDCNMWGKRAESVSRYLSKGSKVTLEGRLRWSQWEDKNGGGKRSKLDVVVDEIEFMSQRQDSCSAPSCSAQEPEYVEATLYDSAIPF